MGLLFPFHLNPNKRKFSKSYFLNFQFFLQSHSRFTLIMSSKSKFLLALQLCVNNLYFLFNIITYMSDLILPFMKSGFLVTLLGKEACRYWCLICFRLQQLQSASKGHIQELIVQSIGKECQRLRSIPFIPLPQIYFLFPISFESSCKRALILERHRTTLLFPNYPYTVFCL